MKVQINTFNQLKTFKKCFIKGLPHKKKITYRQIDLLLKNMKL